MQSEQKIPYPIRINKEAMRDFSHAVRERNLSITSVLSIFIEKFTSETDKTIKFLLENKEEK